MLKNTTTVCFFKRIIGIFNVVYNRKLLCNSVIVGGRTEGDRGGQGLHFFLGRPGPLLFSEAFII